MYEVKIQQEKINALSNGETYTSSEEVKFMFHDNDDLQAFMNLAMLNSENITVKVKLIKE